mmetsp:Transcript_69739/g.145410  ORF Transcript_69739/g.145410 Transcript_69739/m.145410 type:complete len:250 (-) Transcript_69739:118-867(-)|eukprot:CAMPEP_0181311050 /NCGR_PEP_ID=MMETSP1101-20121128/12922_1 /TAXON_ID=46948 /ORGANISM="Rhodomonas abbreviata, Strain Caron Lab Isolate" /LENGTH=249 /DNA_ID=CAMNT_0023417739 /DNA_START=23 /DNA_END=772 /DNA_ORIENTATION=-
MVAEIVDSGHCPRKNLFHDDPSRSNNQDDRIPILVDKIENFDANGREGKPFRVPSDLTVGQFVRGLRKRLNILDRPMCIYVNNVKPSSSMLMSSLFENEKNRDGMLVVTCRCGNSCVGTAPSSAQAVEDAKRPSYWTCNDANEAYRSLEPEKGHDAGAFELVRIVSESERRARQRFRVRMHKRAAGPKAHSETPSNFALAQAMANCKLDTMLSGMIEVAVKKSTSPAAAPISVSLCGNPCVASAYAVRS